MFFQADRLADAIQKYTASLAVPSASLVATILYKLSLVALKQCRPQNCVAFAAAALRLSGGSLDKAAWRLGQSLVMLRCY